MSATSNIRGGTPVASFTLNRTWRNNLALYIAGLTQGTPDAQRASQDALERMADLLEALSARVDNCQRYGRALDAAQLAPNGDDFNTLLGLINGRDYAAPHKAGR